MGKGNAVTVIVSIFKWVLYMAIFATMIIVVILGYKDYKEIRKEREEIRQASDEYYTHNCLDFEKMNKMRVVDECHDAFHKLEEDPGEYAIYEILARWSIFGNWNLNRSVRPIGPSGVLSMVELISSSVFLSLLILLSIGMCMCSRMYPTLSMIDLPTKRPMGNSMSKKEPLSIRHE